MHKLEKEFGIDVWEIQKYQTPAAPKFAIQRPSSNGVLIPAEIQKLFKIAVGLMLFSIKFSRPNISNAVRELAKVNYGATQENFKLMLHIVKIVLYTHKKRLRFKLTEKKTTNYGTFMVIVIVTMLVTKKQESALVDYVFL